MKILHLYSENIKRIKAVEITPEDNVVVISGENGEGKTSVLDSIWLAIKYSAAKKGIPVPLRAGETSGFIEIDLGKYIVTRKFTEAGSTLEVRTPEGSKITSPQKMLDGLIGDLSFDPWEFSRKKEVEQREMLADVLYTITKGELDLADFDARHKEAKTDRTDINRDKKNLTAILTQMTPPVADDPTEEIAIGELTKSISEAVTTRSNLNILNDKKTKLTDQIKALKKELSAAEQDHKNVIKDLTEQPELPDIEVLQGQLTDIELINKRAREVILYTKTQQTLTSVDAKIKGLNDTMELIEIEKAEALEDSPLPVSGLRITPDGIMVLNESEELVPFCQASAAQRLRISLGIAMAANPTLRVIRIADGSLLDDKSMDIVRDMAEEEDFQVWLEFASRNKDDVMGIRIEDGMVADIAPKA